MDGGTNAQPRVSATKFTALTDGVSYAQNESIRFSGTTTDWVWLSNNGATFNFKKGAQYLVSVFYTPTTGAGGIQPVGCMQGYSNADVWKTGSLTFLVDTTSSSTDQTGSIASGNANTYVWFIVTVVHLGGGA